MSQNTNNPYEQGPAAASGEPSSNPYMQSRVAESAPDLDAAAPTLRSEEQQRVNRKALMFLGGIVLLLALMAILVFKSATRKDAAADKPAEEQVNIPTLADTTTPPLPDSMQQPAAQPIDVQSAEPMPQDQLPPLPPSSSAFGASPLPPPGMQLPSQERREPTLMERRMGVQPGAGAGGIGAASQSDDPYAQAVAMTQSALNSQNASANPQADTADEGRKKATSARMLRHPDALLVRGTTLRCVLSTRIISEADGYTSCMLTEPVYSINGRTLLMPRGSKIYGTYQARPKGNRIEVIWDRVTTPSGVDVTMSSPGVDNLGSAGVPGYLDSHWATRITSAVMVSLLSDAFKYAAAQNGPSTATVSQGVVVVSPYQSNTARTLDSIANRAAEQAMSRPPTVTINQGTLINVYIARDVDFTEVLGR